MTTLTKKQFRLVLVAYCLFSVFCFYFVRTTSIRVPLTVAILERTKQSFGLGWLSNYDFAIFMVWQLCTILVAHLIGLLFLFLFWREGLYIFLFAVCARLSQYLFFNISRQRLSPWGTFICWIGILFEFTILAVAFFGPAKLLFQRRKLLRFKLGWRVVSLLVIWVVLLVTSLILGFKHGWRRIRDWPDLCVLLAIVIIGPLSFWWDRRCLAKIAHMAQVDRDKILSGMSAWKRENYVKALERYNAERSDKPNITPATPASNPGHPEP